MLRIDECVEIILDYNKIISLKVWWNQLGLTLSGLVDKWKSDFTSTLIMKVE